MKELSGGRRLAPVVGVFVSAVFAAAVSGCSMLTQPQLKSAAAPKEGATGVSSPVIGVSTSSEEQHLTANGKYLQRQGIVHAVGAHGIADDGGQFNALGATLFSAIRWWRSDKARLDRNLDALAKNGFDYVRVIGDIDWGTRYGNGRDVDPGWPDYAQDIAQLTDYIYDNYGMRVEYSIFGGDALPSVSTPDKRKAVVDEFLNMSKGREQKIIGFEIANEPLTGVTFGGSIDELKGLAQYLKGNTPILVATGSVSVGGSSNPCGDLLNLNGGNVSSYVTIHPQRYAPSDFAGWKSASQAHSWDCGYAGKQIPDVGADDEPIGPNDPGNPNSSEIRADRLVAAAVDAWQQGMAMYTYHAYPGKSGSDAEDAAYYDQMPGIDEFKYAKAIVPSDSVNWQWHNGAFGDGGLGSGAPGRGDHPDFEIWADGNENASLEDFPSAQNGVYKAYVTTSGNRFFTQLMDIAGSVQVQAIRDMSFYAIDPTNGKIIEQTTLHAGDKHGFSATPSSGSIVILGQFGPDPGPSPSAPPSVGPQETCSISTSLGNTSTQVAVGDVSACDDAFNSDWAQLCSSHANASFSFSLTMPSKGQVGSGTDYCSNGQASGTPPPQTETCSISTSLGNTSTQVAVGNVSACDDAFNSDWAQLCSSHANASFSFSLTMPSKGQVGSGTDYCSSGQASSTPPAPTTETCSISTSLGDSSASVTIGDVSACDDSFNHYWAQLCGGHANASFSFSLTMPSKGQVGSGTDYCSSGQPSSTPPATGSGSGSGSGGSGYLGCYTDSGNRALPALLINSGATVESCRNAAQGQGYSYIGLQYGGQCFAGNSLGNGSPASASDCDMPCSSDSSETCGGTWRNSVYSVSGASSGTGSGGAPSSSPVNSSSGPKSYQVSFESAFGKYMSAENGGGTYVLADRDSASVWETFTLVDLNGGNLVSGETVHLIASDGDYLTAEGGGGGVVNANRSAAGGWEGFTIVKVNGSGTIGNGDSIALQAQNGEFFSSNDSSTDYHVTADRSARGGWETWTIRFR